MKDIFILEHFDFSDKQFEELKSLGNIHYYEKATDSEIKNAIESNGIILLDWIDPNDILKNMKPGQFICLPYTGYGWIKELPDAVKRGVIVSNTPNYSTNAVAEHHFALLLSTMKKVAYFNKFVKNNQTVPFNRNMELANKTVGIIGLGRIGSQLAIMLEPFNVNILTYNRTPKNLTGGVKDVSLEELLKESDIVCVTCVLNNQTNNMLGEKELKLMKENAILTATTGGIINLEALAKLVSNKFYGIGLDDCDQQVLPKELLENDKVVCTYHRAYDTHEAEENRINICIQNIKSYINGNPINLIKF